MSPDVDPILYPTGRSCRAAGLGSEGPGWEKTPLVPSPLSRPLVLPHSPAAGGLPGITGLCSSPGQLCELQHQLEDQPVYAVPRPPGRGVERGKDREPPTASLPSPSCPALTPVWPSPPCAPCSGSAAPSTSLYSNRGPPPAPARPPFSCLWPHDPPRHLSKSCLASVFSLVKGYQWTGVSILPPWGVPRSLEHPFPGPLPAPWIWARPPAFCPVPSWARM